MKIEGFSLMLAEIEKERGVSKETLSEAIAAALLAAYKRKFKNAENMICNIDNDGVVTIIAKKKVVTKVTDDILEITKTRAKHINAKVKVGDEVDIDVTPKDFGRLAAQTAKQVIIQRIREAEKNSAFDEYSKKVGEIINGIVQRREANGYLVNLGRVESLLPFSDSIPNETYRPKDRIKVFIVEIKKLPKGPMVVISRTHPNFIRKLFEIEIPEIAQGIIEIKSIVREPGRRSKIAVISKDKNIGAVGTCIGHMGNRIQNIVREIANERIDVVEWSEDIKTFIKNALSPAKITKIKIVNKDEMASKVIVPEDQLSLAIGKEGQNVRLAAKITGWKIDITSEDTDEEEAEEKEEKEAKEVKKEKAEKKVEKIVEIDDGMIKIKAIAAEIGRKPKEVLKMAIEMKLDVKTSSSKVTKEDQAKITNALNEADEKEEGTEA